VEKARVELKDSKPGTMVALSEGGPLVMRPAIRSFWNDHYRRAFQERVDSAGVGECIISGVVGPIVPTHEKIKGVANLGGQAAGVSLISFDKAAFRSYGWEQNANSPVGPDRAAAYVLALNHLLRPGSANRRDVAGVGFIFWTKETTQSNLMDVLNEAAPEQVTALLNFDAQADPDPNMFYMAGIAGNGARLLVRYWVAESLSRVKENLKDWFEGLRVITLAGELSAPAKMWQLLEAIKKPSGEATAQQTLSLMRRAIEGNARPLGSGMLGAILARLRHAPEKKQGSEKRDYRFTAARMGLLRLCINDSIGNSDSGERLMGEGLDVGQESPAYLCGRLLAEYEGLQEEVYRSAGEAKVNLTIADRYYSLASTSPKIAFPKIEGLARSHFRKLRRNKPGAMNAIERRVIDLHERIGTAFPASLDLDKQGRFALGYYHQKAERSRQIAEFREKRADESGEKEEEQRQ
jgi:CRISPR-associated protein Csd1